MVTDLTETAKYPGQLVFGLDIGTRSIVGTVGYYDGSVFHVVAQKVKEHETRAMLDGQIHDIAKVGSTIAEVKEALEEQLSGRKLKEVCIAAAGRVLRTTTTRIDRELDTETVVTSEMIYSLDLAGVEKAYEEFQQVNDTKMKFYCVGYSVVRYYLNGYPMGNLEDHKARAIGAELIATFLPDDVVDGLYRAVQIAGLKVANLTLEPIAAIRVAIPQMYRMLNIALVDVGAGTSDISITRDGSIIAYGMIPSAGDEITETIAGECLVDFGEAEKIKIGASRKGAIKYKDIMGIAQKLMPSDVLKMTEPVVNRMTKEISDRIKELNGDKPVSAVFVVGGGGKIPGFTKALANELGIQSERVALRGEEVLKDVDFQIPDVKKDSLLVTPIGICMNFYDQKNNFIFVSFNREQVKLYDNSKLAIVDAAMQAGLPNEDLFPKRGKDLNFTINGKRRMQRGELGEAAVITLNGEPAGINTPIQAGDKIIAKASTAGADASLEINKLPEFDSSITVIVNEKKVVLPKFAQVNGELQSGYYEIQDQDDIKMLNYYTVKQIAEFMDVILNPEMKLYVNNKRATLEERVYENFSVLWTMEDVRVSDVETDMEMETQDSYFEESVKEETEEERRQEKPVEAQLPVTTTINVTVNGKPLTLSGRKDYIFVDVFDHIDFDLSTPQGKSVAAILNGNKALYTDLLKNGDVLEIYWIK